MVFTGSMTFDASVTCSPQRDWQSVPVARPSGQQSQASSAMCPEQSCGALGPESIVMPSGAEDCVRQAMSTRQESIRRATRYFSTWRGAVAVRLQRHPTDIDTHAPHDELGLDAAARGGTWVISGWYADTLGPHEPGDLNLLCRPTLHRKTAGEVLLLWVRAPRDTGYREDAMAQPKVEGTVSITENDQRHEARYEWDDDIVTIYIGEFGPYTTHSGGLLPETVARMYLREFLDGRLGEEDES
jgi:hypothetical protein